MISARIAMICIVWAVASGGGAARAADPDRAAGPVETAQPSGSPSDMDATRQALASFGFLAAGTGAVSETEMRNAIARYQLHMDYPVTGRLADGERQVLLAGHDWLRSGGAGAAPRWSKDGQGARGLLRTFRDRPAGPPDAAGPATGIPRFPGRITRSDGSGSAAPPGSKTTLGPAALCHSDGGRAQPGAASGPADFLRSKFCEARALVIAEGEALVARLDGLDMTALEPRCQGVATALAPYIEALARTPPQRLAADVAAYLRRSDMPGSQLAFTARVCLAAGYGGDDVPVALGAALLLVALDDGGYGELMGHHLREGIGIARQPDLALAWYEAAFAATEMRGPAFAPENPRRTARLRAAVMQVFGTEGAGAQTTPSLTLRPLLQITE